MFMIIWCAAHACRVMSIVSCTTAAACLIIYYASLRRLWHAAGSCIHNMWVTTTHDEFWVLMGLVWCAGEDEPSVLTLDPTERRHFEAWTGLGSPTGDRNASQRQVRLWVALPEPPRRLRGGVSGDNVHAGAANVLAPTRHGRRTEPNGPRR